MVIIKLLNTIIEVTEDGRVKSLNKGIFIKQFVKKGYATVVIYVDSVRTNFFVHRLVAKQFIPNPENKPEVNHIDGNKLNNNVSNLEWVSKSENIRHAIDTGLMTYKTGVNHHNSRSVLSSSGVEYGSLIEASKDVKGDSSAIIRAIRSGTKAYGYYWQYKDKSKL